jgi:hypothetical protein
MRIERLILISFLGNYLINNIVAAIVAMIPLSGNTTAQYVIYFVLAAVAAGIFTWWYLKDMSKSDALIQGAIFGAGAFVVAVVTAFVSGISGVLAQTGSFSQLISVLPNFGPFILNWSTLALLGYWVLPAAALGWWLQMGGQMKMPMMGSSNTASSSPESMM